MLRIIYHTPNKEYQIGKFSGGLFQSQGVDVDKFVLSKLEDGEYVPHMMYKFYADAIKLLVEKGVIDIEESQKAKQTFTNFLKKELGF